MTQINTGIGFKVNSPIRVGIVGTGFAAKLRAETLVADARSHLVTVAGRNPDKTAAFCQTFGAEAEVSWRKLVERDDLDLVIVCTVNRDHGAIVLAALENDKHVVVEYPLSLDVSEAERAIALAAQKQKLLHIEHIELLGGLHQAIKESLPLIGKVFYARYITITPQRTVPQRWTFQHSLFGFPLIGAISRLHRFTDLFGEVGTVNCQTQFWDTQPDFYKACLCNAQLRFTNGVVAEAVYGKGETFWQSENIFTIYGEAGTLIFTPESGQLIQGETRQAIAVGTRRGLFAKDTDMVLDCLLNGTPLYVKNTSSLYALKLADAARRSSETRQKLAIDNSYSSSSER
ncbi:MULTISPECIES: Gfo/Idh/MocA family protein [unclassified Microcoleus]|uniref:Gfo/Idh/MocA family protein n=1 Tax=unclassified Microcoleus TaxID=2642155 RepID=UPI001D1B49AF|nr:MULTISPECIES: Gfo/Idh/MocA family oxidoreductase [unclassified Microcoleus]MCC3490547.1 Gfo/Idh/MocA family oxidoreductase [Microcoleus sp. PH2017_16_JOR_D_A]MCC3586099.1 Gfo/Idh/MocA family oxidoreductase [Microcoleus sp. PH2017_30_WIL_O_A]MCC3590164.1 Gfo/Idh/MocA family oxidoreductase [Microcoleus sp. PH2017_28_MFU_U_A]